MKKRKDRWEVYTIVWSSNDRNVKKERTKERKENEGKKERSKIREWKVKREKYKRGKVDDRDIR